MGMHTACTKNRKEINALFFFFMVVSSLEQSLGFFFTLLGARLGSAGRLVHLVVPAAQQPCPRAQLASRLLVIPGVESPLPLLVPVENRFHGVSVL